VTSKDLGKLDEAISAYTKALSIKPDFADGYYNMANAFQSQGKLDEAIEAYTKALSIKPDYAEAYSNLAVIFKDQDRLDEAIEAFNKAIYIKPDYAEAFYNMGLALKYQGKLEEAIEACNKALSIKPDFAEAWQNTFFQLQAIKTQISPEEDLTLYYPADTGSNYGKIQLRVLDYKLHRGHENEERYLDETLDLLSSADDIVIRNPKFDNGSNGQEQSLPDKMVALVHFGRSGTGLMHSLVDGHPEVSSLPSIYFSEYFDHATWVWITSTGWDGMIDRFVSIYEVLFDASSSVPVETKSKKLIHNIGKKEGMANVGDKRNEILRADKGVFRKELKCLMASYNELNAFVFFKLVHNAYNAAINDSNSKNLIFYHIHNPDTYAQLNFARFNPDVNWLLMVREPIQSCESWIGVDFSETDYFSLISHLLHMLFEVDNIIYHKQGSIGVRLEDLKEHPRKTIPALCKWLGIEQNDILYKMTAQGKKWWGDPSSPDFEKDGYDPFGKTSIKRKTGLIFSEKDQFILRTLFYPFSVRFGYTEENEEQFKNDLQKIRPMIDELFDFEKKIAQKMQMSCEKLIGSGSYLYLRSGLIERWNTLTKYQTYPKMIEPLRI
jgi:lipoprotein NlpI